MQTYKARAIVLHTLPYGDSSAIAYLYTDLYGRQSYMVQGIKSSKGKGNKMSMFQPAFILEYEGIVSQKSELHRIKDLRHHVVLPSIPFDVRKSTIAVFISEVLYKLVRESEANGPLFDFLLQTIPALDALEDGVANFHLWFLVKLSFFLGFYPGNRYSSDDFFDLRSGTFVKLPPQHSAYMLRRTAYLLGRFMELPLSELDSLKINREERSAFLSSLLLFFEHHLEAISNVRSIEILREVF